MTRPIINNIRQVEMSAFISQKKQVTVGELMEVFNVSDMTVRRDLSTLEKEGVIKRVHGGAIYLEKTEDEDIPLSVRTIKNKVLKETIAQKAVELIQDHSSVLLDAGTTLYEIAKQIYHHPQLNNLTVITNDINIGYMFSEHRSIQLVMPGGELRSSTKSFVGPYTSHFFKSLNIDQAFIGCSGISFEKGVVMNSNLAEADVKAAMIEASTEVTLVADCHKLTKKSFVSFAQINQFQRLITNAQLPENMKTALREYDFLEVKYV